LLVFLVRVRARSFFEAFLSLHGQVDLAGRYSTPLYEAMRQHDGLPAVKKVEHAIVETLELNSKLVDAVTQVVGFGTSKFMAELS